MGDFIDTAKSVFEAGKALLKSGSSVLKKGAEKVEEAVADQPLPDQIKNFPAEVEESPVQKFAVYKGYYERLAMLWAAKYSQAESTLNQLKNQMDTTSSQRVDALEDINEVKDAIKAARRHRDMYSPSDPIYAKRAKELADLEKRLAQYQSTRSTAHESGRSLTQQIKNTERDMEVAERERDRYQEQFKRSVYHFNKAVEEAARKK